MQIYFYLLGNLDGFSLGTWTIFTWELGRFSLGNLDDFYLGTWTVFTWELGQLFFTLPIGTLQKKRRNALRLYNVCKSHKNLFFTRDNLITQFFCHIQKC